MTLYFIIQYQKKQITGQTFFNNPGYIIELMHNSKY